MPITLDPIVVKSGQPVLLDPLTITSSASWNPLTTPVDYFKLSGFRSPGMAELTGASSPRKWEERGGYGLSGATVVFRGVGLCYFTFKIKLYTEAEWAHWLAWKPLVDRPPFGTRAKARTIWHPFLDHLGVSAAVIEEVSQPEQGESGEWIVSIKFIEFRKPVVGLAKPEAAPTTPLTETEIEIEKEKKELADLLGQP